MDKKDFKEKFFKVAVESKIHLDLGLTPEQSIDVAWESFQRILKERGLGVMPNDPISFEIEELSTTD